jgi:1-acyl-sn-glycerol-3-phosphate acyltransferase
MRLLYMFMYVSLKYAIRIYFKKTAVINGPKEIFGSTIYVSNHAASFMDPLTIASLRRPIIFFMTRSDVFTPLSKPFLWSAHMLPIYRQHDGEDTKKKNEQVFDRCAKILKYGRNLLIFGEGFTDDVFIRRLKPVKKGAVRIGFSALEKLNWEKNIYIAAAGANYSKPNMTRSNVLIETSDKICLNDYKEAYLENPGKVILDLSKEIEKRIQDCITHIQIAEDAPFHENIMEITRKGMHPTSVNKNISLTNRHKYSQKLAHYFNENKDRIHQEFSSLRQKIENYNLKLKKLNIADMDVVEKIEEGELNLWKSRTKLLLLLPFTLLGIIHCGLVYWAVKWWVEKSFRREVFWGSVKFLLALILMGLVNIPVIFLFHNCIYPSYLLGFLYYTLIGLFFLAGYTSKTTWINLKRKKKINEANLSELAEERKSLLAEIEESIPIA